MAVQSSYCKGCPFTSKDPEMLKMFRNTPKHICFRSSNKICKGSNESHVFVPEYRPDITLKDFNE